MKTLLRIVLAGALLPFAAQPNATAQTKPGNKPECLEWFCDLGFGMFIHWNVDGTLGGVISHSLVGASKDYSDRFFNDLPKLFNPRKYNPEEWAELAKLAGMQYLVFTIRPEATESTSRPWSATPLTSRTATGEFRQEIRGLEAGQRYQFQAIVKHPLLTLTAKDIVLTLPAQ